VEALVRWNHPERGLVPPDEFIPLAEHTALMQPLTAYVLDRALAQCRRWLDEGRTISMAVNVSARSLHDPAFFDLVVATLERHGVPPDLLDLEITESSIMVDPRGARDLLVRLHDLGVRMSIDDFGTGYSSLAYLKTLPVHSLKIDRSFVRGLEADQSDAVIVQSVIDLGRNLGLSVVAEGVEDGDTADHLTRLGCTMAQGWYWSRAQPAHELQAWVDAMPAAEPVRGTGGSVR
jgi:EAL domain-containing protein (putative c-di-GMP-specific phosphodiesterase class I)